MIKEKNKHYGLWGILAVCFMAAIFLAFPVKTEAATFKSWAATGQEKDKKKVGNYYIWLQDNVIYASASGSETVVARASKGRWIRDTLMSDGSTVYYMEQETGNSAHPYQYIYQIKINGKNRTCVGKTKNYLEFFAGYYNGNVYFDGIYGDDYFNRAVYQLNTKTKEFKQVVKGLGIGSQYKQYWLVTGFNVMPRKCSIFNSKKGTTVKISDKAVAASFVSGKVYYAEKTGNKSVCIKSCSLSGKSKKTVVKKIPINSNANLGKITSSDLYYNVGSKYYRYNFKTKKPTKIKQKDYLYSGFYIEG